MVANNISMVTGVPLTTTIFFNDHFYWLQQASQPPIELSNVLFMWHAPFEDQQLQQRRNKQPE
jgi:hypothetical protein